VKTLVVVQARMGSTRLPGKVLRSLGGRPVLERMLERLAWGKASYELVVATTTEQADDPIVELCAALGIDHYRGHRDDLLDRHYCAALERRAEVVVKIPSDCPLIDPAIVDRVLAHFSSAHGAFDYVSNLHPATYPDGNDVEVMTMAALETAWREARWPWEREHTTPFLWERPQRFRIGNVAWETGRDLSMSHRMTLDYEEDHQLLEKVFSELSAEGRFFPLGDVVRLLDQRPDLRAINALYAGVNWYRHHLGDLSTIHASATRTPEARP
jgi:spore coat polysaccharide biosynthesis protein SpsF